MTLEADEPAQQYYIVQVYLCKGKDRVPVILRVGNEASGADVLRQAVEKHGKDPTGWRLVPAKGDGTPDTDAGGIDETALLNNQGLTFPYMLCLVGDGGEPCAEEAEGAPVTPQEVKEAPVEPKPATGKTDMRTESSRKKIKEYIAERQAKLNEVQKKREANVAKILAKREERERRHLETCEKHEVRRRERVGEERQAAMEVERREGEAVQRRMLERELQEERRQMEEAEVLKEVREEAAREAQRRGEALVLLDKEREVKAQKAREKKRAEEDKRRKEMVFGRSERMASTLQSVLGRLATEIDNDANECEVQLARERSERAQQDKENYERRYVERLERERSMVRERERHLRLAQESKQTRAIEQAKEQQAARLTERKKLEEEQFHLWKTKRRAMIEEDTAVREHINLVKMESERRRLPAIPT